MRFRSLGARRALVASALLALAALMVASGGSAARPSAASDAVDGLVDVQWTPVGLRNAQTTVVLELTGKPVTVAEAEADRAFSKSEKDAWKAGLKAKQDALTGSIQALGGTVLADYQVAYNGVKVRIDRSKVESLRKLVGVVGVHGLQRVRPDNEKGIPLIGAPAVWAGLPGLHGEGIKIAVIDTGIDFTHANFGGPGTVAAFNAANAVDTLPPQIAHGWGARVKGGIDLVGDDYNADPDSDDYQPVPHPDPNPLDCNGHGSHVAGSAAGSGVTAAGATYTGPYNATTVSGNSWRIGPGVAPKADLYGVRVFGCEGSTDVTVDAIEWAVDNDMDVINMSLGSPFGTTGDPSAVATTNAAQAGVIVVTSAGNSGPAQYITGSPGTSDGAISTAAIDPTATFPGVTITTSGGLTVTAVNANAHPYTGPISGLTIKTITNDPATAEDESLGCSVGAFGTVAPNTLVVVNRGVCARVAKAIYGQKAGAAAVAMVNNSTTYPPIEGKITSNPDTGEQYTVIIPFLGVRGLPTGTTSDGAKLRGANGQTATLTPGPIPNPNYLGYADFSSGGPRTGDSGLKPNISAPGVATVSTGVGTGNGPATISGTSMASPHVAGVAALTRQAHPTWSVADIKASIVNTGDPAQTFAYRLSRGGTGLVQPAKSTATQVVAKGVAGILSDGVAAQFAISSNYGFEEFRSDFSKSRAIKVTNNGSSPASFNLGLANQTGSPHSVSLSTSSLTVPGNSSVEFTITLNVPAATVGNSDAFREVGGLVTLTPTGGSNNGVTLRVPYYLVPRAYSQVKTTVSKLVNNAATATITNSRGALEATYDWYQWGLESGTTPGSKGPNDIRAVGVQSFPVSATQALIVFAINTHNRWSNAATNEFDVDLDLNNDGAVDYTVVAADVGLVTSGSSNGTVGAFVFDAKGGATQSQFAVTAPTDSSTILVPVLATQLCRPNLPCLKQASPRFTYAAFGFDLTDSFTDDTSSNVAKYNVWTPAIGPDFAFGSVAPNATKTEPLTVNPAEWAQQAPLGLMSVSQDNRAGADEADLVKIK